MDPRIFNILQRVQREGDDGRRAALMAETNEELARHFASSQGLRDLEELAFDLFNLAWADTQPGDLTRTLVDVRTVGLNETAYIEEDLRGMRAYFQGKGGQIRGDIIRYERQALPREELVAAIDMHLDEIRTNFWGMLSKLQTQAREKMRTAPAHRLIELIRAAVTGGSAFLSTPYATIAPTNVDPVLDYVAQKSGGGVTIFGTQVAIRRFANIGLDFGDAIKEGIFRTGVIGQYKGYPIAQLENWEDFNGQMALPDDEVYVVGRNAGSVVWYGEQPKVQQLQRPSFYIRWETARDVGISIHGVGKGRVGRIVLT